MFGTFRTRSRQLERIDTGDYTAAEYELWQGEMVFIHRWLGETRAIRRSLIPIFNEGGSVLDVGAGSGELINTISEKSQIRRFLCGVDLEIEAAKTVSKRGFSGMVCSGSQLPFADNSFDHVVSSLVFHHLSDEVAVAVLQEMMRVARGRIFVIDLRRSVNAYLGYRALSFFLFQRLTREDGALSVQRGFTDAELRAIAERAGLREISVKRSAPFRLVLSGQK